ncbi:hypothetical protein Fmac_021315 [Flemingia macrophylla]|uniref:Bulb-type lectin domain-containing protein n=1 Tax=Flemingia macrophylla TaxID=520843 RepID=A0ABD1LX07_9FABA
MGYTGWKSRTKNQNKPDDSINVLNALSDGKTLVSKGGKFELGFFSPVNSTGNLVLTQNGSLVWYTNSHKQAHNPVPCQLPGMKFGTDLKTGLQRRFTAWKSPDDPSPGNVYRVLELYNYPEIYLMKGTTKLYRYGSWNGLHFSGMPEIQNNTIFMP